MEPAQRRRMMRTRQGEQEVKLWEETEEDLSVKTAASKLHST